MTMARNSRVLQTICFTITTCFLAPLANAKYGGGTGELNDPYLIYTPEQMNTIGTDPNDWDKHFKLMADIDLAQYTGEQFNIIGTDKDNPFTGIFDGNSHKIFNFSRISSDSEYIGLFGYLDDPNARISNLGLIDPNVDAGTGSYVGSLVGWLAEAMITNCYVEGGSISGHRYVGGLVGNHGAEYESSHFPFAVILNSHSTTSVSGWYAVGGLIGYMRPGSHMTNCYATGNISGADKGGELGGLVGGNNYGTIERCYAAGNIRAGIDNKSLGGLLGSYTNGSLSRCYATGSISTGDQSTRVGGLVGNIVIGIIDNCYSTGSISGGENSRYLGGLVGFQESNGTLDSCFATGSVHGGEDAGNLGGLVGQSNAGPGYSIYGFTRKCFWDVQTSGLHTSDGGMGLTTAQMINPNTYSLNGWAGNPNWLMDAGKDYPRLEWEGKPGQRILDVAIEWFEGKGTQQDPYVIRTAEQLALIGTASVIWNKCFILVSDLDLAGIALSRIGICDGMEFTGKFEGNGHVIRNLTFGNSQLSASSLCLFGLIGTNAAISNLGIENVTILGGDNSGPLGGLAGQNRGKITRCYAIVNITAGDGSTQLGGLVGYNRSGIITQCYATGCVSGGDAIRFVGGLAGDNNGEVIACRADSVVKGGYDSRCIGGLTGINSRTRNTTNCYATGSVTCGDSSRFLGGLVGSNLSGRISCCYTIGTVGGGQGSYAIGGLAGDNGINGTTNMCYFLTTSDRNGIDNGLGTALTDTLMKQQSSFVGWDFVGETANGTDDIWWILEGQDYPRIWWEDAEQ